MADLNAGRQRVGRGRTRSATPSRRLTRETGILMFDTTALSETFWNSIVERLAQSLCKLLLPRLEALLQQKPHCFINHSPLSFVDTIFQSSYNPHTLF